jgi:hypothetical protein
MNKPPIFLALVHYPVYNKRGEIITTSITNLDLHDISRSCITFGVKNFFIVTPLSSQQEMLARIIDFWNSEAAKNYNPHRALALNLVQIADSLADVKNMIIKQESSDPVLVGTTANITRHQISYGDFRDFYQSANNPVLLIFGTGNGLAQEVLTDCNLILQPIDGTNQYNHLSVRSAAAIILDRLTSVK